MFVAGSALLHKFIASRLADRTDIWIAKPLSSRNYAQGTVFRMKPDVTVVDLDPIWNPTGLPLAIAVSEACPAAHVILFAPEGYAQGPMAANASRDAGWSAILRRKGDAGERLTKAIVAGLSGGNWIDPDLGGDVDESAEGGGQSADEEKREWEEGVADGPIERASATGSLSEGSVTDAEVAEWQKRARQGMG